MDTAGLEALVVAALEDIKAKDIQIIDTSDRADLFERIVIASGDSTRQVKALANNIQVQAKAAGCEIIGTEGESNGEWVLVDLGSIVVHVMQPAVRVYYNLEDLWRNSVLLRHSTN